MSEQQWKAGGAQPAVPEEPPPLEDKASLPHASRQLSPAGPVEEEAGEAGHASRDLAPAGPQDDEVGTGSPGGNVTADLVAGLAEDFRCDSYVSARETRRVEMLTGATDVLIGKGKTLPTVTVSRDYRDVTLECPTGSAISVKTINEHFRHFSPLVLKALRDLEAELRIEEAAEAGRIAKGATDPADEPLPDSMMAYPRAAGMPDEVVVHRPGPNADGIWHALYGHVAMLGNKRQAEPPQGGGGGHGTAGGGGGGGKKPRGGAGGSSGRGGPGSSRDASGGGGGSGGAGGGGAGGAGGHVPQPVVHEKMQAWVESLAADAALPCPNIRSTRELVNERLNMEIPSSVTIAAPGGQAGASVVVNFDPSWRHGQPGTPEYELLALYEHAARGSQQPFRLHKLLADLEAYRAAPLGHPNHNTEHWDFWVVTTQAFTRRLAQPEHVWKHAGNRAIECGVVGGVYALEVPPLPSTACRHGQGVLVTAKDSVTEGDLKDALKRCFPYPVLEGSGQGSSFLWLVQRLGGNQALLSKLREMVDYATKDFRVWLAPGTSLASPTMPDAVSDAMRMADGCGSRLHVFNASEFTPGSPGSLEFYVASNARPCGPEARAGYEPIAGTRKEYWETPTPTTFYFKDGRVVILPPQIESLAAQFACLKYRQQLDSDAANAPEVAVVVEPPGRAATEAERYVKGVVEADWRELGLDVAGAEQQVMSDAQRALQDFLNRRGSSSSGPALTIFSATVQKHAANAGVAAQDARPEMEAAGGRPAAGFTRRQDGMWEGPKRADGTREVITGDECGRRGQKEKGSIMGAATSAAAQARRGGDTLRWLGIHHGGYRGQVNKMVNRVQHNTYGSTFPGQTDESKLAAAVDGDKIILALWPQEKTNFTYDAHWLDKYRGMSKEKLEEEIKAKGRDATAVVAAAEKHMLAEDAVAAVAPEAVGAEAE